MIGKVIAGHYQMEAELGSGGMGTVYRGLDTQIEITVAVKHLKPEMASPDLIQRFQREGEALRDLNHPNMVKMLDAFEEEGHHYLVMEYVSGGDLKDLIQKGESSVEKVLKIAIEIADALTRAHHLNIIHRDLKPANILIAEDGTARLTDFGIARVAHKERITDTEAIIGTIDYLAPEAFSEDEIDHRVDIWAFGVLLFEMLTSDLPFKADGIMQKIIAINTNPTPDLEALRSDIPIAFVDLIYRMLEKDRNARIVSMRHIGASLEDIIQGRDLHTPPETRFATPLPDIFERPKHNLPAQTTEFVGREAELSELAKLLDEPKIRLLTIVAQGGMGKTRLALELANRYVGDGMRPSPTNNTFENGVYFVELAPLSDPNNIVSAIADATGYQFQSDEREPKQQILDFLANKNMLLLLDNFEHLLDGANLVTEMLNAAPILQILVTSRQHLNQSGETVFNLAGMHFSEWAMPEDALEKAAVKLFLLSAKRVQPQFELTAENTAHVAHVCQLVEGMPLGILLAATWLGMLSADEIAHEIAQGIDLLESDISDLPERHRSIRTVFDYSWELMSETERDVFMRLSIFRGGFTREAAQAVTGATLRTLMNLMKKSLIRRDVDSGRYDIHGLLRQYGVMQLQVLGDKEPTPNRHANYFNEFMRGLWTQLKDHRQKVALDTIETEFENIRLAWHHLVNSHVLEIREFASSLWFFASMRNQHFDGLDLFTRAIDTFQLISQSKIRDISLGHLIGRQAFLFATLDKMRDGKNAVQKALIILENYDCAEETIMAYESLAMSEYFLGNSAQAQKAAEKGLNLAKSNKHDWGIAHHLYWLGLTFLQRKNFETALSIGNQCYQVASAVGDTWMTANAIGLLQGRATKELGNYSEARRLYQEALTLYQHLNKVWGIGRMYQVLGEVAYLEEDYHQVSYHLQQALQYHLSSSASVYQMPRSAMDWSDALIKLKHFHAAIILLTCISKYVTHSNTLDAIANLVDEARKQLPLHAFEEAQERGKSGDLETIVQDLLDEFSEKH